jgi:hypothetical protein
MRAKLLMAVAFLAVVVGPVYAETVRFTKGPGTTWTVGDKSHVYHTKDGKAGIQMLVQKSPNTGKAYYVIGYTNKTSSRLSFGSRVSEDESNKTFFTGHADVGKRFTWGEHLPANINSVYVMYEPR